MPVHCRVRPNDMKMSESKAHLLVILHSLLRCGLSLCRSPPGPPTAPAPRPPSLLELRFPAPSAASPGEPGPGVPPHLSALVTVPGTRGPARFPFHSYRGQTFRLPAVISELSKRNENPAPTPLYLSPLSGHSGSAGLVTPEGLWLHFSQHPSPLSNVVFFFFFLYNIVLVLPAFKTRICC